LDEKAKCQPWIVEEAIEEAIEEAKFWMMKPKLDENRIKIR
jgi:hypothetical protein